MLVLSKSFRKSSIGFCSKTRHIYNKAYDIIHEPFPVHYPTTEQVHFLKATDTVVFSENYIRWASKENNTISVCIKSDGCTEHQMFRISKNTNPEDYQYLNTLLGFIDDSIKPKDAQ